jgi:hypothetical protein
MFFRGISPSPLLRAAYLLVVLCFVTVPLEFLVQNELMHAALSYLCAGVFLFGLLLGVFQKPRDARPGFYAFVALLIHVACRA